MQSTIPGPWGRLRLFLFALATLFVLAPVHAQTYYGSLRGLITDATGSSIAAAQVSLIDEATNIKRATVSTGAGEYVFSSLNPGTYTLVVESPSFKKYQQKGITVSTQQTVAIDVSLTIGSAAESIEVNASGPVIDTSTASNGQLFDSQKLTELPNLGRNPFLFSKLANNVTPTGDPRFNRFQDQSGSSQISIAGAPTSTNNYLIDGVPISDFSNRAVIIPSLDAVQEVKVMSNAYDAEVGRAGGGVFNTLLRSGNNTLHGSLYGTTRQTDWQANTWANNYTTPKVARQDSTQYSYAGSLGGPVWIPKIYNGRDKTFFWVTGEGYRQASPLPSQPYYLPNDAERAGDFSGSGVTIYDPTTSVNSGGTITRTAFNGNVIPSTSISTVAKNILAYIPRCTSDIGCTGSAAYGTTNYIGTDTLKDRANEFIAKLDHKLFPWWLANASYMHYGSKEPGGNPLHSTAGSKATGYLLYRKVDAFQVNNTLTPTPTLVVTSGFGFNRFPNDTQDDSQGFDVSQLGFPGTYASGVEKAFPAIVFQSNRPSVGTTDSGPAVYYSRNFFVSAAKTFGRHTVKAGYVFRSISLDFRSTSYQNGLYNFTNAATSKDNVNSGGLDFASFLLGIPVASTSYVQSVTPLALNVHYQAIYAQDDIRVTPKLALNVGLRYEYEPGIYERSNHYTVGFDTSVVNPISQTSGFTSMGGVEFAGQNGYGSHCCTAVNSKWSPRAGFAYSLTPKTVLRGGYGLYYVPIGYTNSSSFAPGYSQNNYINSTDTNGKPIDTLDNPFPNGFQAPTGNAAGYATGLFSSVTAYDSKRRAPFTQQYSLDIQQELPYGFSLELGYVGLHGRSLLPAYTGTTINANQLPDQYLSEGSALGAAVSNPYYGNGGTGSFKGATVPAYRLLKPYAAFDSVNLSVSSGESNYNSMIVKLQRRFANGFTLLTAFTWASNWDSLFGQTVSINPGNNGPQDANNLKAEYARSINDIPKRFTLATTYELPFGRGKALLNGNRWIDLAVGGWSLNWISNIQDGGPLAIQMNSNVNTAIGAAITRPNLIGNPCLSGHPQDRLNQYFNTSAFSGAAAYTYGNTPRTIGCYGPGLANNDISIFKNFKVKEKVNFQFRAEALNAFNTPQFAVPSSALLYGGSNFGKVGPNVINFPRLLSLGGRIEF